jgi:predicted P-loop ATPase
MKLTATPSSKASLDLRPYDVPTEDVTEMVTKVPVGKKDGASIIPAVFRPCPEVCWQHAIPGKKDCGGGALHRLAENVEAVTAFVVDLDTGLTEAGLDALVEALKATGLEFWWWQTFSHTPEVAKGRLIIPFHTPFPLKSPEQWSRGAWPKLIQYLGVEGACSAVGKGADPSCRDPSRLYYMPRRPTEDAIRRSGYVPGKALDWEEVFGDALEGFREAVKVPVALTAEDPNAVVTAEQFEKLREDLVAYAKNAAPAKRHALENVLKGKMPAELPTERPEGALPRNPVWKDVTWALAKVSEDWMPTEALLEVLRPSWQDEVGASPEDFTPWAKIEDMFRRARPATAKKRAQQKAEAEQAAALFSHSEAPAGWVAPSKVVLETRQVSEDAFDTRLEWEKDKEGNRTGRLKKNIHNLGLLMRAGPVWRGVFRKNLLSQMLEVHGGPLLEGKGDARRLLKERTDALLVRHWISEKYGVVFSQEDVDSYIELSADDHAYDPLMDYLNGLVWDGTPRIEGFLERYFSASTKAEDGKDRTLYVRAVSKRWLMSAAARGLFPGCQVDVVLILESGQGKRKTSAFRVLGGEFFASFVKSLDHKDAQVMPGENWILEFGELSAFSRSDQKHLKDFLTQVSDKYRAPYDKRQMVHPRRAVWVGSTNEDDYLTDETGNRRYWPVAVGDIDSEALRRDRDQLFAEAVARVKAGEQWHLTEDEEALAKVETALRLQTDSIGELVLAWFQEQAPEKRPVEVTQTFLWQTILGEPGVPDRGQEMRGARALKMLGFTKRRMWRANTPVTVYIPTPEVLGLPRATRGRMGAQGAMQIVAAPPCV